MQKLNKIVLLIAIITIAIPSTVELAIGQTELPNSLDDIQWTMEEQGVIIIVGIVAGTLTAYLGMRKAKRQAEADKTEWKFDISRFLDRAIIGWITGVEIAIVASLDLTTLNLFNLYIMFMAIIGQSEFILQMASLRSTNPN